MCQYALFHAEQRGCRLVVSFRRQARREREVFDMVAPLTVGVDRPRCLRYSLAWSAIWVHFTPDDPQRSQVVPNTRCSTWNKAVDADTGLPYPHCILGTTGIVRAGVQPYLWSYSLIMSPTLKILIIRYLW